MKLFSLLLALAVLGSSIPPVGQQVRAPRNAEEFDRLFQQVTNWGRWGNDDQLGAINLITSEKRKAAVSLATTGMDVHVDRRAARRPGRHGIDGERARDVLERFSYRRSNAVSSVAHVVATLAR